MSEMDLTDPKTKLACEIVTDLRRKAQVEELGKIEKLEL